MGKRETEGSVQRDGIVKKVWLEIAALKMKGSYKTKQCEQPLEALKDKKMDSPLELPERNAILWTPEFYPSETLPHFLTSDLQNCRIIHLHCFKLKGSQPWIFIGRNDAEAEAAILWPPDVKSWFTEKDSCWERLKAGREGDDRGWDGWMASPARWTWAWASSRSCWRTGKPGVLQSMGSQSQTQLSDWTATAKPLSLWGSVPAAMGN